MKKVIIYLVLAIIVIGGGYYFLNKNTYTPPANNDSALPANTNGIAAGEPNGSAPKSYTLSEVSKHKDSTSCWSAINGEVYDLTSWIGNHPGGEQAILSICGKDGSSAFNDQHEGQKKPANELAKFLIGTLSK